MVLSVVMFFSCTVLFLMIRRPPRSTRTDTLLPYTALDRSVALNPRLSHSWALNSLVPCTQRYDSLAPAPVLNAEWHWNLRSEEHTSELQSLMRISYAVFCLNKKNF